MTDTPRIPPSEPADSLDPSSLAAIRGLLEAEADDAQPSATHVASDPQFAPDATDTPAARKRSRFPELGQAEAAEVKRTAKPASAPKSTHDIPANAVGGMVARMKSGAAGYRPTVWHVLAACSVLILLFRPWLVVGLLVLGIFLFSGVLLVLGYDGFWQQAMRLARWQANRNPEKSEDILRKLDGFAMRFDAFLDRFPEGTVDGLYLPDLGNTTAAEARHNAALDRRFDGLRDGGS